MPEVCPVAIVIPCKDELASLERTISSLLSQSVMPARIVIVDDNSSDGSLEVAKQLSLKHPVVESVEFRSTDQRESGAKVVRAVNYGLGVLESSDYEFIAKFDADLEFPNDYLARVWEAFRGDDRVGLVGGQCQIYAGGEWTLETVSNLDHVRGALKCYRRKAFEDIGGFYELMGWDTLDEHELRYRGWSVTLLENLSVKHHRETNAASDPKVIGRKIGVSMHNMGLDGFLAATSVLKRMTRSRRPFGEARYVLTGYLAARRNKARVIDPGLAKYIRAYRYKSLLRFFKRS